MVERGEGQESNPGRCGEDWALMVRLLPSEPPGHPVCLFNTSANLITKHSKQQTQKLSNNTLDWGLVGSGRWYPTLHVTEGIRRRLLNFTSEKKEQIPK